MRCICIWHWEKTAHSGSCVWIFLFQGHFTTSCNKKHRIPQKRRPLRNPNLTCTSQHLPNSWKVWYASTAEHPCLLADQAKLIVSRWQGNLALWNTLSSNTIPSETWTGIKPQMPDCRLIEISHFGGIETSLWGQLVRLWESARSAYENEKFLLIFLFFF